MNLALTCPHCNAHKWTATEATDPDTSAVVRVFHPRSDNWAEHFEWSRERPGELVGRTPTGRATISALQINAADVVALRALLAEVGLFPDVLD